MQVTPGSEEGKKGGRKGGEHGLRVCLLSVAAFILVYVYRPALALFGRPLSLSGTVRLLQSHVGLGTARSEGGQEDQQFYTNIDYISDL